MDENLQPDLKKLPVYQTEILNDTFETKGEIVLVNSGNSTLSSVRDNIAERIKLAKNSAELDELLQMLESAQRKVDKEIEQQEAWAKIQLIQNRGRYEEELAKVKLQEIQKDGELSRRILTTNLTVKIVGSGVSCGIGLYLFILNTSLIGPLFMILGLATALNIPLGEISKLLSEISKLTREVKQLLSGKADEFNQGYKLNGDNKNEQE